MLSAASGLKPMYCYRARAARQHLRPPPTGRPRLSRVMRARLLPWCTPPRARNPAPCSMRYAASAEQERRAKVFQSAMRTPRTSRCTCAVICPPWTPDSFRLSVLNFTLLQMYAGAASGVAATPGRAPKPKTPRCEDGDGAGSGSLSPNQRVRKLRRSGPAFSASPGAAAALFSCTAWLCIRHRVTTGVLTAAGRAGRPEDAARSPRQGKRLPDIAG